MILILHVVASNIFSFSVTYFALVQANQKFQERVLCIIGGHGKLGF